MIKSHCTLTSWRDIITSCTVEQVLNILAETYFHCPVTSISLKTQDGGYSDALNKQLFYENHAYLLRIFKADALAASREQEIKLLQIASDAEIAPKYYFHDNASRFVLMDYITGASIDTQHWFSENRINRLIANLEKCHHIKITAVNETFDLFSKACSFIEKLNNASCWFEHLQQQLDFDYLQSIVKQHQAMPLCLIHNDLHPKNILQEAERLWFIDWTDAGLGSFYSDLSMLSLFMRDVEVNTFLSLYTHAHSATERYLYLQQFRLLRLFLLLAWSLIHAQKQKPQANIDISMLDSEFELGELEELSILMNRIIEGTIATDCYEDFSRLTPIFMHHYLKQKQEIAFYE